MTNVTAIEVHPSRIARRGEEAASRTSAPPSTPVTSPPPTLETAPQRETAREIATRLGAVADALASGGASVAPIAAHFRNFADGLESDPSGHVAYTPGTSGAPGSITVRALRPLGAVALVCSASCDSRTIALHLAAALAAGNRVVLCLPAPVDATGELVLHAVEGAFPHRAFRLLATGDGFSIHSPSPYGIAILTPETISSDFEPAAHFPAGSADRASRGWLLERYSDSTTLSMTVETAPYAGPWLRYP